MSFVFTSLQISGVAMSDTKILHESNAVLIERLFIFFIFFIIIIFFFDPLHLL